MGEWNPPKPTADEATNCREVKAMRPDSQYAFAAWLPQVGGYASMCRVVFDRESNCRSFDIPEGRPGCFDVSIYHDGDFPRDEKTCELHFCDPCQLIRFATHVLEQMAEHQAGGLLDKDERDDLAHRIASLKVVSNG